MTKGFLIIIILCLLGFVFLIQVKQDTVKPTDINFRDNKFIAHAGGGIMDINYTNSKESVIQSISDGFRFIELDLLETSDNSIVAAHDWKSFKENCLNFKGKIDNNPLTYRQFNDCNYQKKLINFSKLDEDEINQIFDNNKKLFLVTDKIKNYKLLSKKFNFTDRIIPETYSLFDFVVAKYYGFKYPIFPYKKYNYLIGKIFQIKLMNVSYSDFLKNKKKITKLYKNGIHIYVYTSNDGKFIEKYINNNITGVYTDFWNFNFNKCLSVYNCNSY